MTLAFLAGQTRRVRLGVSAYVMPYRNPVVTAKQVATLDALSGGRVVLADRRRLAARRSSPRSTCRSRAAGSAPTTTSRCAGRSGRAARRRTTAVLPAPAGAHRTAARCSDPHPPIWIAGNSDAALHRAARHGDGWHGIDLAPDELAASVERLRAACAAQGREPARSA